ncbi:hypothetical protein ACQP1K_24950 [Sphaerimonospora sp. CA-214678]|uniref:hypothetical protein n=1 Tax=Sphaerimonospora sp. CA-214678 TaxID=3240029 RepID=UPI003D8D53BA
MTAPPAGIVLYGPPASGKTTITTALHRHDPRFRLLPKLKAGTGRTEGYEPVTAEELNELRRAGRLLVETRRYGNVYAIDGHQIEEITAAGHVPVVHMGNIADLRALVGQRADGGFACCCGCRARSPNAGRRTAVTSTPPPACGHGRRRTPT